MATFGMWKAFNRALFLIAKTSVNVYNTIPMQKLLVYRSLTKIQILWLHFAEVYLLINSPACLATLSSLTTYKPTKHTRAHYRSDGYTAYTNTNWGSIWSLLGPIFQPFRSRFDSELPT